LCYVNTLDVNFYFLRNANNDDFRFCEFEISTKSFVVVHILYLPSNSLRIFDEWRKRGVEDRERKVKFNQA